MDYRICVKRKYYLVFPRVLAPKQSDVRVLVQYV